jgi:dihydrofolate reductase
MAISIIAAVAKNRAIGFKNQIPWHLQTDLQRFKKLTAGHPVIMGQKTFVSLGSKPLPNRRNIILSSHSDFSAPNCVVVQNLSSAMQQCNHETEIFIIGGGRVYQAALPFADKMYLTWVDASPKADVFFPEFNPEDWNIISRQEFPADDQNDYPSTYTVYERKNHG